jgi:Cu/Ag efflux protein CusF
MAHHGWQIVQTVLASILTILMLGAGPAAAQLPLPLPSEGPGARAPQLTLGMVEGTVMKVDPTAGAVEVSWGLFELSAKTLSVIPGTQIQVEGRPTNMTDIREGDKVKASYEVQEGRNVADSIELTPAPASRRIPTPQSLTAPPAAIMSE